MIAGLFNLAGKKALVTGGSRGVGRACATALAMAGSDVAIVGRTREPGEATCGALRRFGVNAYFVKCDVSEPAQVEEMTQKVVERFGRIDIAINNAGRSGSSSIIMQDKADWDRTFAVNLTGVFLCAQAQVRQMSRQTSVGGKIINIASVYATIAGGNSAYNASKAGLVHFTKSLAAEVGAYNINVNCISPGWMLTPGNRLAPEWRERMREVTPMGSLLRYEDIYGAVVYLSSPAADLVTGHDLVVDGGHTVNTWLRPLRRVAPPRHSPEDEESGMRRDLTD